MKKILLTSVLIFLFYENGFGQEKRFDKVSVITNAAAITATAFDIHLQKKNERSGLVCEGNRLYVGKDGCSLNAGKAWGVSLGLTAFSNVGQALLPRKFRWLFESMRLSVAGGHSIGITLNLRRQK